MSTENRKTKAAAVMAMEGEEKKGETGNNLWYWTGGVVTKETPGWERKNMG